MVTIKSEREIELMREAGKILAKVHEELGKVVRPGISTKEIDRICEEMIRSYGCIPSFLGYEGYPASVCISINDEVVHGIPNKHRYLNEGDIVSLDTGVIWKGYQSDAARTHMIGEVTPQARKLVEVAHSYGVKVVYHSCGSIVEAIPLLIEAGVDIIHPIQALAAGMDPQNLKDKFEGQVSFCGGVDTQDLLPNGTPEQVAAKVKELRTIFPTGLIISPSHEGLQEDVPPQNIKAMFDEVNKIY